MKKVNLPVKKSCKEKFSPTRIRNIFMKCRNMKYFIKYEINYILKDTLSLDEILKYILFAIASKSMKYIRINLTRYVLDWNTKIYKTSLRKLRSK